MVASRSSVSTTFRAPPFPPPSFARRGRGLKPTRVASALVFSMGLASLSACVVTSDDYVTPVPTVGRMTLRWTINGIADPLQCRQAAAPTVRISIFSGGAYVSDYVQGCETFGTTIDLYPGDYNGTVHLEDSAGLPRTTNVDLLPFRIIAGTNLDIPVDFPANSFY